MTEQLGPATPLGHCTLRCQALRAPSPQPGTCLLGGGAGEQGRPPEAYPGQEPAGWTCPHFPWCPRSPSPCPRPRRRCQRVPAAVSTPRISTVTAGHGANSALSLLTCQGIKGERGYIGPPGEKGESVSLSPGSGAPHGQEESVPAPPPPPPLMPSETFPAAVEGEM